MSRQKEELLNRPAARLILYRAGKERKEHLKKTSSATGLQVHRVRNLGRKLEEHDFAGIDRGQHLVFRDRHEEALRQYRSELKDFSSEREDEILQLLEKAEDDLKNEKRSYRSEKRKTDSVKKQKKLENRLESVSEVLSIELEHEDSMQLLNTSSRYDKACRIHCGRRLSTEFNFVRKGRTARILNNLFNDTL